MRHHRQPVSSTTEWLPSHNCSNMTPICDRVLCMEHRYGASAVMSQIEYKRRLVESVTDLWALVTWVYVLLATLVFGISGIISLIFDRRARFLHLMAWAWGRSILLVSRVRVEIEGAEYLDLDSPKILMVNHQSQFDIWALLAYLPRTIRFVAKKELTRVPIIGQVLVGGGHVIIDRQQLKRAFASYDKAAKQIRAGTSIVVFVEGTRSPDGRLLRFKKGGFMLALAAGVPIIPITLAGGVKVLPRNRWRIRPGKIRMIFHKPIDPTRFSVEAKEDLMATVREAIASSLDEPAVPSRRQ